MKKVFAVFILLCFLICLIPIRPAKANSFPSEFFVNSEVYYSAEAMFDAYTDLTETQREICAYILGMYNLMYLGARGFQFQAGAYNSESSFIAKVKSFGYRFLNGAAEIALRSRMDDSFCKYASACILYSSQCNVNDFDEWFDNLDENFVLPVDQGLLNSFTLLYNDNSNEGIAISGDVISPWNSGDIMLFGFNGVAWDPSHYSIYNSFLSNNEPVLYSNFSYAYNRQFQYIIGTSSGSFPDTLFIVRDTTYNTYAYGYTFSNGTRRRVTDGDNFNYLLFGNYSGTMYLVGQSDPVPHTSFKKTLGSVPNATNDLSDTIDYIFQHNTPVPTLNLGVNSDYIGYYPFIRHVVLVDNINDLSNPEEVYNTDSWDVVNDLSNMLVPVDPVGIKPKIITTIDLPDNTSTSVDIQDIIDEDNTVDSNGDPVNPWQITVIVQPNDNNPISIDVNMFSSAKIYIQYLWNNATAFLGYCKDLLDCFAFTDVNGADYGPKYAIYGVIVLGVASGLIAKFLL